MNKKRIFLAGDSTVAYNDIFTYPQTGWGQVLHLYLKDDIEIYNYAKNGRSSKSFMEEGRLEKINQSIQAGDFLLIQFGHNDQKEDEKRHTEPYTTYQEYLTQYVEVARKNQAIPVLITSLYRRHFDEMGNLLENVHGEYPHAMVELGDKLEVPVIDLCTKSKKILQDLGEERSRELFMNLGANQSTQYPEGIVDNTHLRYKGAIYMAGIVANELKQLGGIYQELVKI
ncbi:MAG: rhamnogalacturonan acetylesterase [Cellulosilyticaceae bacterium]